MADFFNDVAIEKLSGGLGRRTPNQDMVSGLLFDGEGVVNDDLELTFAANTVYRLASLDDAETVLGITEAYDTGGQSVYYQIKQFFRMNPSGDLYIKALTGVSSIVAVAQELKTFQEETNGAMRQIGVIYSGATVFETADPAENNSVEEAIAVAQTQANEAYTDYMPFEVIIEGKGFVTTDISAVTDLSTLNAENVSVMVSMDPAVASTTNYANTAAVGVALGTTSAAKVSENIGWVEKFNLTGEGFSATGFVGGAQVRSLGSLKTLSEKKYLFTRNHTGLAGVYFADSHTATAPISDFTYIENNRTINKVTRIVREALLPKVNSPVLVDPEEGTLPPTVTKGFEALCLAALERMISNEEVSAIDVYVDPFQNILADSILKVKIEVVPVATARRIEVELGFDNPFGIGQA